jgi:hypothetical protein
VAAGWNRTVVVSSGDIELEQLDEGGEEWFAVGPGGDAGGGLREVLLTASAGGTEVAWIDAVVVAIGHELSVGERRVYVGVAQVSRTWFHATRAENRDSIRKHGLDWAKMTEEGIAGSKEPEWPGIFLCSTLESARWFARMPRSGHADIWEVELHNAWLESAPADGGGMGGDWMICPTPIDPKRLRLLERDIRCGRGE